eukprot:TRINITY_DN36308_c2_g2_i1.p1 TRINITY_DN36308_c2_g2~~TRINITY_DN36308_c2_g2_i1.p1  ORF type:complete len:2906 (-),score=503.86 TRINITY_DN36308_c2_g2_i1:52-8769(-)
MRGLSTCLPIVVLAAAFALAASGTSRPDAWRTLASSADELIGSSFGLPLHGIGDEAAYQRLGQRDKPGLVRREQRRRDGDGAARRDGDVAVQPTRHPRLEKAELGTQRWHMEASSATSLMELAGRQVAVPHKMRFDTQVAPSLSGNYVLVSDRTAGGFPLWKQDDGDHWIFSGRSGHWIIGGNREKHADFDCDHGLLATTKQHAGRLPAHFRPSHWQLLEQPGDRHESTGMMRDRRRSRSVLISDRGAVGGPPAADADADDASSSSLDEVDDTEEQEALEFAPLHCGTGHRVKIENAQGLALVEDHARSTVLLEQVNETTNSSENQLRHLWRLQADGPFGYAILSYLEQYVTAIGGQAVLRGERVKWYLQGDLSGQVLIKNNQGSYLASALDATVKVVADSEMATRWQVTYAHSGGTQACVRETSLEVLGGCSGTGAAAGVTFCPASMNEQCRYYAGRQAMEAAGRGEATCDEVCADLDSDCVAAIASPKAWLCQDGPKLSCRVTAPGRLCACTKALRNKVEYIVKVNISGTHSKYLEVQRGAGVIGRKILADVSDANGTMAASRSGSHFVFEATTNGAWLLRSAERDLYWHLWSSTETAGAELRLQGGRDYAAVTPNSQFYFTRTRTSGFHVRPRGVEDPLIAPAVISALAERRISATSVDDEACGRVEDSLRLTSKTAWCPETIRSDDYVEIDLGMVTTLGRIETMGRADKPHWVRSFGVSYSLDGESWFYLSTLFAGNVDAVTIKENRFEPPLRARSVRVHPLEFIGWPSFRLELYETAVAMKLSDKGGVHLAALSEGNTENEMHFEFLVDQVAELAPKRAIYLDEDWKCNLKQRVGAASDGIDDAGQPLAEEDCQNYGFMNMTSCKQRCARSPGCFALNFDASRSRSVCDAEGGFCGMVGKFSDPTPQEWAAADGLTASGETCIRPADRGGCPAVIKSRGYYCDSSDNRDHCEYMVENTLGRESCDDFCGKQFRSCAGAWKALPKGTCNRAASLACSASAEAFFICRCQNATTTEAPQVYRTQNSYLKLRTRDELGVMLPEWKTLLDHDMTWSAWFRLLALPDDENILMGSMNRVAHFESRDKANRRRHGTLMIDREGALELTTNVGQSGLRQTESTTGPLKSSTKIADGAWHHVAVVWSRKREKAYLYVDGMLHGSESDSTKGWANYLPMKDNLVMDGAIFFGGGDHPNLGSPMKCEVANVKIWKRALAQDMMRGCVVEQTASSVAVSYTLQGHLLAFPLSRPPLESVNEQGSREGSWVQGRASHECSEAKCLQFQVKGAGTHNVNGLYKLWTSDWNSGTFIYRQDYPKKGSFELLLLNNKWVVVQGAPIEHTTTTTATTTILGFKVEFADDSRGRRFFINDGGTFNTSADGQLLSAKQKRGVDGEWNGHVRLTCVASNETARANSVASWGFAACPACTCYGTWHDTSGLPAPAGDVWQEGDMLEVHSRQVEAAAIQARRLRSKDDYVRHNHTTCGGTHIRTWSNGQNAKYRDDEGFANVTDCQATCLLHPDCSAFMVEESSGICSLWRRGPLKLSKFSGATCYVKRNLIYYEAPGVNQPEPPHGRWDASSSEALGYSPGPFVQCEDYTPCLWQDWQDWGGCSRSCGTGRKVRSRTLASSSGDAETCVGTTQEVHPCDMGPCPIHCVWEDWQDWEGACSKSCGGGQAMRARVKKVDERYGGTCLQSAVSNRSCNEQPCPVDCTFSIWSDWTPCDVTCGMGWRKAVRTVATSSQHGGKICVGSTSREEECTMAECEEECTWSEWKEWKDCSVSCGGGFRSRHRSAVAIGNATGCGSKSDEMQMGQCGHVPCPVHCVWNDWQPFGDCSVSCGGGNITRYRTKKIEEEWGGICNTSHKEARACNSQCCPVDCRWGEWESWSDCSVSCNGGLSQRKRTFSPPVACGGLPCSNTVSLQSRGCGFDRCPVDCHYSQWNAWSECSLSCGGGTKVRRRQAGEKPSFGGKKCTSDGTLELAGCGVTPCPIFCEWNPWGSWSSCSTSCGTGFKRRSRSIKVDGAFGAPLCSNYTQDFWTCNAQHCPLDCKLSEWSDWGVCSITCNGPGNMQRTRRITQEAAYGGLPCSDFRNESHVCGKEPCAQDCIWHDWQDWGACSASDRGGVMRRVREVGRPVRDGGRPCTGGKEELRSCGAVHVGDCMWDVWSSWSMCSTSCSGGEHRRIRRVLHAALEDGKPCEGPADERKPCENLLPCPQDCRWQHWGLWGACDSSCGGGLRKRYRGLVQATHGGADCLGVRSETTDCNEQLCPQDCAWKAWEDWGACTVSCGGGAMQRYRLAIPAAAGGRACEEQQTRQVRDCNDFECPVDCHWRPWSEWSECPVSCGTGISERTRGTVPASFGGRTCKADVFDYKEHRHCNDDPCPVDALWGGWQPWGACSTSCGGGSRLRRRHLLREALHGGRPVPENQAHEQVEVCNAHDCPVDCVLGAWSDWNSCSGHCDHSAMTAEAGHSQRQRATLELPSNGGASCPGPELEVRQCQPSCTFHCEWGEWSEWTPCGTNCKQGNVQRLRIRPRLGKGHEDAAACSGGEQAERTACPPNPCSEDCEFSDWSDWSSCSRACRGERWSNRHVVKDPTEDGSCDLDSRHRAELCNVGVEACENTTVIEPEPGENGTEGPENGTEGSENGTEWVQEWRCPLGQLATWRDARELAAHRAANASQTLQARGAPRWKVAKIAGFVGAETMKACGHTPLEAAMVAAAEARHVNGTAADIVLAAGDALIRTDYLPGNASLPAAWHSARAIQLQGGTDVQFAHSISQAAARAARGAGERPVEAAKAAYEVARNSTMYELTRVQLARVAFDAALATTYKPLWNLTEGENSSSGGEPPGNNTTLPPGNGTIPPILIKIIEPEYVTYRLSATLLLCCCCCCCCRGRRSRRAEDREDGQPQFF